MLYRPEVIEGLPNPEPYWYTPWRQVYGAMRAQTLPATDPNAIWHTIRLKLSKVMLIKYQLNLSYIAQVLQETVLWAKTKKRFGSWTPLLHVIASPDYETTIDIHVRVDHMTPLERIYRKARIQPSRQGQLLVREGRKLFLTQVVMYVLSSVRMCGVPELLEINWRPRSDATALAQRKITSTTPVLPHEQWEVITRGSAFREVFCMPFVDISTLFCNNIDQMFAVLGVEAVRQLYLVEMRACMSSVDETLLQTMADHMCCKGYPTPANRFGANPLDGPLTRASNEMSTQTLLRAAITHQRENLAGVSASVMLAQPIRIGTGLPQISWNTEKWLSLVAETESVVVPPHPPSFDKPSMTALMSRLSLVMGKSYGAADVEEV